MLKTKHPIRLWRLRRQITLRELALLAEIDESYLSVIETGNRQASQDVIRRLSMATGIPQRRIAEFRT